MTDKFDGSFSVSYLVDETEETNPPAPLLTASLELCEPDLIYRPSLDKNMAGNIHDICTGLVEDIYGMADLLPRISDANDTYLEIIRNHKELRKLRKTFMDRIEMTISEGNKAKDDYLQYSYLWLESKSNYMHNFLTYSRQLTDQEFESGITVEKVSPKLIDFNREIVYYENLYEDFKKLNKSFEVSSWFLVDVTPLKLTLQMCAKKWGYLFKKHLLDIVVTSFNDLQNFLDEAEIGLQSQISEGDYEGLVKIMGYIKAVKDRQPRYEAMFGEMNRIIRGLSIYFVSLKQY